MNNEDKLSFLKHLHSIGLRFYIGDSSIVQSVEPEQIVLAETADQLNANAYGISVEEWQAYAKWQQDEFPCHGLTKQGKPCRLRPEYPASFYGHFHREWRTFFCRKHGKSRDDE